MGERIRVIAAGASCAMALLAAAECGAAASDQQQATCPSDCPPGGERVHDGFYFRFVLGVQYTRIWGERDGSSASLAGIGPSLELYLGGTPFRGLVVGGTFGFSVVRGDFEGAPAGAEGDAQAIAPILGPFVDWYPDPSGPWHTGAALGFAGFSGHDAAGNLYTAAPPGAALFAGWDGWVGSESSLGLGVVVQGALPADAENADEEDTGYRLAAFTTGIQGSFVFH
jgi:hypothetical protein